LLRKLAHAPRSPAQNSPDAFRVWLADKTGLPSHAAGRPGGTTSNAAATGLNVLLVEDQTIIALDTENMLSELGAASVQSFTTAEAALSWLADARADVGVLDIALGKEMSYPVADLLLSRSTPFLFTTGYGDTHHIPPRFAHVPVVHKPYGIEGLAEALERCLVQRRSALD
jgi:DNA-binding NtrC family response regulator